MKNGNKEGRTEFANSAKPLWAARILSREKITRSIVNMQNTKGMKLRLNLKNIIFILGIPIKSPCIIYFIEITNMQKLTG